LISKEEMILQVEKMVGKNGASNLFINAWNAMLLGYKPLRIDWVKKLGKSHKLLMLSNTNAIHFDHFSGILMKEYGISLYDLFEHVYLSHEMHLMKPDIKIFQQVINEQQLEVSKTLFIEDTQENAEVARNLGIHSLVIPRNGSFYEYFCKLELRQPAFIF
jgi:putative hydrolase of the HAD superfamily